ncbi:hypothetical protein Tco_0047651 [Tanacetum coccineum]
MKDEAGSNLNDEENDFMLDNSYGDETLEELTVAIIMMARIQPADDNADSQPFDDPKAISEKLSSHDIIVYKMGQSIQTIHMLGKTPNKVYDPFLKAGMGYKNPERLKKAIAAQPKMYHGEMLHSTNLKIDSPDFEETLEDAEERVWSSNSVRRPKSKDTKLKNRVLKNTNAKSSSANCIKYQDCNAINDGSNLFCVSCGKDVFLLSHEKCVARYALSRDTKIKRALFTTPIAAKSKNLGATFVVAKSRLSVANTPTATNKSTSGMITSKQSLDMEIMFNTILRYVTYTMLKA